MFISKLFGKKILAFTGVLFLFATCGSPDRVTEQELANLVSSDNKFSRILHVGNVKIKVIFKPTDLLVAQELQGVEEPSHERIADARKKYSPYYYFTLHLETEDGGDLLDPEVIGQEAFGEVLQTISFRMGELVRLTTSGRDMIPVADYIYNRTFGLNHSTELLFVFDRAAAVDEEWIQIEIDEFGLGLGRQNIRFEVTDLDTTPRIFQL